MTARTELIARLRKYSLRSGYAIHCHAAADMLEDDASSPLSEEAYDIAQDQITKLQAAARLALDAIVTGRGKHEAIAALKEALK